MSSRMTNLELSTSIKDYIKELFEGNNSFKTISIESQQYDE